MYRKINVQITINQLNLTNSLSHHKDLKGTEDTAVTHNWIMVSNCIFQWLYPQGRTTN